MKKKELKKAIEELTHQIALISEKMYRIEITQTEAAYQMTESIDNPVIRETFIDSVRQMSEGIKEVASQAIVDHKAEDSRLNRTMKDVKVGDTVRYSRCIIQYSDDSHDWQELAGMVLGCDYQVESVINDDDTNDIRVVGFDYWHDIKCFELING
jgi:hypothetical protein